MKKIILMAVCLITNSQLINAQETVTNTETKSRKNIGQKLTIQQRAQKNVDEYNLTAQLTEEQKISVLALATTKFSKIDEIKNKYNHESENKVVEQNEISIVRKDFQTNLKTVLTPEQIDKIKKKQKENRAAHKNTEEEH